MKLQLTVLIFLSTFLTLLAQKDFYQDYTFSEADTLRGSLNSMRSCYDVTYYDLHIKIDPDKKHLEGYVDIHFRAVTDFAELQVDLFENMNIERIVFEGKELDYQRRHDAVFVTFPRQSANSTKQFRIYYEGYPKVAIDPPWNGGFVWEKDRIGNHWVGVACEGDGASLWWPNKDHLSDEPDSMMISVAVPRNLTCVANGNLKSTEKEGNFMRYNWFVSYPINNYNVSVNIADYVHFTDEYTATDQSKLALDYYVLSYNLEKAQQHFAQVPGVLACYETYFGKYPFWNDGFALVETPYLGMEHQSAIAYGNEYMRGYKGSMIPRDMNWDYIIVHETGHEYFGNSISCNDLAEMWIHESFTTYMEAIYVECAYSYEDAIRYMQSQRRFIFNREPILGPKGVNWEDWQGSDHYYKGAWMLHTLRHAINDDTKWWEMLKGFYTDNQISNVVTQDFIDYVNICTGWNYSSFFEQYLEYPRIPTFIYEIAEKGNTVQLRYKWDADVTGFNMPLMVGAKGNYTRIFPTTNWQEIKLDGLSKDQFRVPKELFYIKSKELR